MWNTAISESVNSAFFRLGPCVKKMSATMNHFTMMMCMLSHNEITYAEKTMHLGARFRS